jgi:hypothetical protein
MEQFVEALAATLSCMIIAQSTAVLPLVYGHILHGVTTRERAVW